MNRQEANRELLLILTKLIEEQAGLRWSQILYSYGFTTEGNEFYKEPNVILARVITKLKEIK